MTTSASSSDKEPTPESQSGQPGKTSLAELAALFLRLGFNAVFYASVLAGSHMPNLMYMTTFDNMAAREQHWKDFNANPFWKQLVASPQYQHNVSHVDIVFLHPTDYSDL